MADVMHSILDYHLGTSHTRNQLTGRSLNTGNQPVPFKLYREMAPFQLPQKFSLPDIALDKGMELRARDSQKIDTLLAGVCNLATGITQVKKHTQGTVFHLRSIPSAGALYPTELYVALQNVSGLNDGLYHYSPLEHTLTHLRAGQVFSALAGSDPIVRFYLTAIFHRSTWKYGPRGYRYCLLDAGHAAENLMLACRMHGLPATLSYDFKDRDINDFLCIDPMLEGCLAQVHALGCSSKTAVYDSVLPKNNRLPEYSQCSARADIPPELLAAHQLTSAPGYAPQPIASDAGQDAMPLPNPIVPASAPATIQQRRSRRNFITTPAPTRDLVDILSLLCQNADVGAACTNAIQVGFLAGENSGLTPGYHRLDLATCSTTLLKQGEFMARSARTCLDQGWLENAAMHIVFTADLRALEASCGPRAYRYAQMEAGRLGHRSYLAATAKQLGACGIGAFFDQEATTLFDLPDGHALLYLVAIGPIKK